MVKQTVTQRSFLLGELREDFLEGDDLELRGQSCKTARNVRVTAARTLEARPGTWQERILGTAFDIIELRPTSDLTFGLIINDTTLEVINESGGLETTISAPWTDGSTVWVEPFREMTVIGGTWGLKTLTYDAGTWTLANFAFAEAANGATAQPYWAFHKDVQIQPSSTVGAVTVTASLAVWTASYVGVKVRYGRQEILLTGYVSPTVMQGTVISGLPPSFQITVGSGASFRVGDAVVGVDTNYQGLVLGVSGNILSVATTSFFDGPDVAEKLSSPRGSSAVTAKTTIAPLSSPIWDEALISPARGYPGAGASAAGRLALVNFDLVPDLVCLSSVRGVTDFQVDADDDDAIVRQCGDGGPRFLHAVNAGDLLLFSDRGLYYVNISDGSLLTPSTFNAVFFDKRAANEVRPVVVADGVVFVEASGEAVAIAQLKGNIYKKWTVRTISTFHSHLIQTPVKLCGPSLYSQTPEKYLFVVNNDGTLAAVSWFEEFNAEAVGFVPWDTQGDFLSVSPIFGGYWAIVDRTIAGAKVRFLERFDVDCLLDCASPVIAGSNITGNGAVLEGNGAALTAVTVRQLSLVGETVHVVLGTAFVGTFMVGVDGILVGDLIEDSIAGFNFVARVSPWPVELLNSPRLGLIKARVTRGSVSMLSSGPFAIRTNATTTRKGGYSFGDLLSGASPLRTQVFKFLVVGRRDHPEIEIIKETPSVFRVLAITQEAVA